ncbi:MAG: hypothetical protein QGG26_16295 [Candidatus Undinarchaeales archaeon]|nr:hypothetical protein [Candidatus Undinarchaeales archaeon]
MTGEGMDEHPPLIHEVKSCVDVEEKKEEEVQRASPYLRSPYMSTPRDKAETSIPGVTAGEQIEEAKEEEEEAFKEVPSHIKLIRALYSILKIVFIIGIVVGAGVFIVKLAVERAWEKDQAQPKVFFEVGCRAHYGCGDEIQEACGLDYNPYCIEMENTGDTFMPPTHFSELTIYFSTADESFTYESDRIRMINKDGICTTIDMCDNCPSLKEKGGSVKLILPPDTGDILAYSHLTFTISGANTESVKKCEKAPIG